MFPVKASESRKKRPHGQPRGTVEVPLRVARRERRRELSREEIVDAARRVMLRDGMARTTLDAIAHEVGLTKAALYYYYPSKDALLFELMFDTYAREAQALNDGVAQARNGGEALRAIVRETVRAFGPKLEDFRLAFLQPQVAGPNAISIGPAELERLRPLNDLSYKGATKLLGEEWKHARGRAGVEPRLTVFLAHVAALGILTMKGLVESFGDPLLYSDEQLVEGLSRIFEAASAP
ncbi:MAG TPA: helix-turn-helix domain-containing protein [Polyangiaceae bacterium]|jgi:AcrR family transcriptional regulator|nr:helix-turn-helix domain-containing protein [Polyangiaceae bacterium]